jgi:hypothetical protein
MNTGLEEIVPHKREKYDCNAVILLTHRLQYNNSLVTVLHIIGIIEFISIS